MENYKLNTLVYSVDLSQIYLHDFDIKGVPLVKKMISGVEK